MTNVNKGHSRIDAVKQGINKGIERMGKGVATLVLATTLATSNVHANEPTFVIEGQTYTLQAIQNNPTLLDKMDDDVWDKYVSLTSGDIIASMENTANLNADTARRQGNIDRMEGNIELGSRLIIMGNILHGKNTGNYTFRQVAKAFDEVASDYSLNISDKSRQVYKTISQAYAQGNTLVHASEEIQQAFLDLINAVRPKIESMPFGDQRTKFLTNIDLMEKYINLL